MSGNPIAAALQALETERQNLTARLGKVTTAIAHLRDAFHLPTVNAIELRGGRRHGPSRAQKKDGEALPSSVSAALKDGPLGVGDLCTRSNVSRYHVGRYVRDGLLVATGATANRRLSLPGRPAKEAP